MRALPKKIKKIVLSPELKAKIKAEKEAKAKKEADAKKKRAVFEPVREVKPLFQHKDPTRIGRSVERQPVFAFKGHQRGFA